MTKPPVPQEHAEQASFVYQVKLQYQHDPNFVEDLFFSTLNGAFLGGGSDRGRMHVMAKLKAEGMNTGVADIIYLQPRGNYFYLCIEMKRQGMENRGIGKTGGPRSEQVAFGRAVDTAGGYYLTAYGAEQAFHAFSEYMGFPSRGAQ